jgi:hypothetical protein
MASIEQAAAYNKARGNEDWEEVESDDQAEALLQDAEDYIRANYSLRSDLDPNEQKLLDNMIYRLAAAFLSAPPSTTARPLVKKEVVEGDAGKLETEYFEVAADPYPYVTTMIQPLVRRASGGLTIGRLIR